MGEHALFASTSERSKGKARPASAFRFAQRRPWVMQLSSMRRDFVQEVA